MGKSSYKKAELLLAVVIISRATSLLIIKLSLGEFQTFNLMALRFGIASICLIPFMRGKMSKITGGCMIHGIILGILFYTIIAVEIRGLRLTDSSAMVAFLENTAIVLVPLAEAVIHRRGPHRQNLVCAVLALSGVGFLLMKGGRFELTIGAVVCMMTAILYTSYIIMNDRLARRDDPVTLGFITISVVAVLSCITTAAIETPRLPSSGQEWTGILLLAVICSSIGTALQPVAQRYVPSERACVFCALNPLATCIMGWIFLGEWQGMSGIAGALLILAAILISQVKPAVNEEGVGKLAGTKLRETLSYAARH